MTAVVTNASQISSTLPTGMIPYMQMQVKVALAEDVGTGDLTAQLLPEHHIVDAHIIARENAVVCGIDWATTCFKFVDDTTQIDWQVAEGAKVRANQVLCKLRGNARSLYTAERCALNFCKPYQPLRPKPPNTSKRLLARMRAFWTPAKLFLAYGLRRNTQ